MRLLLDTHTFIWFVTDNPKLSETARGLINDGNNEIWLSTASIWEMAIKQSTGKLSFGLPFRVFIEQQVSLNRSDILNINLDHIEVIVTLPFHHRDPFDRLIIAQAMVEQIPILSADSVFDAYGIQRLW
ncbi:type II toxin-antitoxin system VapC family toxin [Microseira wollei]|uniref:PilT protein-like n=1 Tax=Microseira wollei NIES-4236 TaxID=2530354 RepID=A0AAV3WGX4_9CYAN|nr:type II toxin-antitoxin system VapC family toxin [Microseira wollei]GET37854.1 PilT protein-like [Microseira wollei NIES-4236]